MSRSGENIDAYNPHPSQEKPTESGGIACADRRGPVWLIGSGQCCAKNGTSKAAILVNPVLGNMHWLEVDGKRNYNVTCSGKNDPWVLPL